MSTSSVDSAGPAGSSSAPQKAGFSLWKHIVHGFKNLGRSADSKANAIYAEFSSGTDEALTERLRFSDKATLAALANKVVINRLNNSIDSEKFKDIFQVFSQAMNTSRQKGTQGDLAEASMILLKDAPDDKKTEYAKSLEDKNDPGANRELGLYYLSLEGDENQKKARALFEMAAAGKDPVALRELGLCYLHGKGGIPNDQDAFVKFQEAAKAGDVVAQRELGRCLLQGRGCNENQEEALKWLKKAATAGDIEAKGDLYVYYDCSDQHYNQKMAERLKKEIEVAVKKNPGTKSVNDRCIFEHDLYFDLNWQTHPDKDPLRAFGLLYLEGKEGCPRDLYQAERLLKKAKEYQVVGAEQALQQCESEIQRAGGHTTAESPAQE